MNVTIKKIKILEPNVKIKAGIRIAIHEKKGINFTDMSGTIIPNLTNNIPDMIVGIIEEE